MSVLTQTETEPLTPVVRLSRIAARSARLLLGLVLIAMVLLNVGNALGRYVFGSVFIGADELLVYGMIWMVMIGMLLVTAERSHIGLDVLMSRVGPRSRLALGVLHHALMTIASAYAAVQDFRFVARIGAFGQTSMALEMPMVIPHSALIVGFCGTAFIAALLCIRDGLQLAGRA